MEEEIKKMKGSGSKRIRELVVYKQKLLVMSKGLEVLDAVDEHYFQASRTEEIDVYFDDHMEKLIKVPRACAIEVR